MGSSTYYLSCNLFVTCNLQLICMPRKKVTNLSIINHHSIPSFGPTHLHVDQLSLGSVFFSLTAEFRGAVTATSPRLLGKIPASVRNGWDLHCLQSTSTQLPLHGGLSSGNNHGTSSEHPSSVHGEVRDLLEISKISALPTAGLGLMAWFDSDKGEFSFFFSPFFFFDGLVLGRQKVFGHRVFFFDYSCQKWYLSHHQYTLERLFSVGIHHLPSVTNRGCLGFQLISRSGESGFLEGICQKAEE